MRGARRLLTPVLGGLALLAAAGCGRSHGDRPAAARPAARPAPAGRTSLAPAWGQLGGGPERAGIAGRLPVVEPRILWQKRLGRPGSPGAVAEDGFRIFYASAGEARGDQVGAVYALDARTGADVWRAYLEADALGLAVADGQVLFTAADGSLRCHDARDGTELWRVAVELPPVAPAAPAGEPGAAAAPEAVPLVVGRKVYLAAADGWLYAWWVRNGQFAWRRRLGEAPLAGPPAAAGGRLFAVTADGWLNALTLDGRRLWRRQAVNADGWTVRAGPVVTGGTVVVPFARREALRREPLWAAFRAGDGGLLWLAADPSPLPERRDWSDPAAPAAVAGDELLVVEAESDRLVALERASGRVAWTLPVGPAVARPRLAPVVAGELAYLAREDGGLYAIDLKTHRLLWSLYLGLAGRAGPDFPAPEELLRPGLARGLWEPATGFRLASAPALLGDGTILVASEEGWLFAVGQPPAEPAVPPPPTAPPTAPATVEPPAGGAPAPTGDAP